MRHTLMGRAMLIGSTKIDFEGRIIDGPAGRHSVEAKVMALLGVLVERKQQVVTREELITAVWGVEFGGDERLSRAVSLLRKALGDTRGNHTHIQTISKQGYRLIADVTKGTPESIAPVTKPPVKTAAIPEMAVAEADHKPAIAPEVIPQPKPEIVVKAASTLSQASTPLTGSMLATAPDTISAVNAKKPLKYWMGVWAATFAAMVMISAAIIALRPSGYISVKAGMEEGLGHIENFMVKNAIEDAQDIFGLILADDPDHAAARAGLAMALMREYSYLERDPALLQRATATADAALREDEHLALANIAVAWAARYNGEFKKSHEFLDRVDILDPNNKLALEGRAWAYSSTGEYDIARQILEKSIELYPNYTPSYMDLGVLLMRSGDFEGAEALYSKAIALSKDNPRAYSSLAQALHMQDKTPLAVAAIQEGLKVGDNSQLYNNLGTYLFFQGQYDMAASAFEKTIELEGDSHDYLYWANLADSYRWLPGRKKDASEAYVRAIQLMQTSLDKDPESSHLNSRLALFSAKNGDFEKSQIALAIVLENGNPSEIQYYRAAVTYEIMADRAEALSMLGHAIEAKYPMTEILNDPELANLRQDPAYHRLLTNLNVQHKGQDL